MCMPRLHSTLAHQAAKNALQEHLLRCFRPAIILDALYQKNIFHVFAVELTWTLLKARRRAWPRRQQTQPKRHDPQT